ncbi:MAG: hypothetical protein ACFFD8_09305 [Candidatus Thorarchaeota archaeon]
MPSKYMLFFIHQRPYIHENLESMAFNEKLNLNHRSEITNKKWWNDNKGG